MSIKTRNCLQNVQKTISDQNCVGCDSQKCSRADA